MATSVLTAHDLLQREIDDMRKDIKELQGEILPENHERMRDVLEGSDYFNEDNSDSEDEERELPVLKIEENDEDDDFDQRIEELSDFMESMGIGPSVSTDDCEIIESDIPLE